jgi:adenine-specific DNA methylase
MDSLEILKAKINLQTTIIKFTSSIEELQAKHPERKDLIDSMLDSLDDISQFQSVFMQFEDEYLLECKANLRLQMVIADLKQEVLMLKEEIKDLKTEL